MNRVTSRQGRGPGRSAVRSALLVLAFMLAASIVAQAQSPQALPAAPQAAQADAGELSLEQLLQVEVQSVFGASKFLQKITDAPAAVTVVTANEIERFGWRTLADVLRNVRGFYVTNDRTYAYLGARGFLRPGDFTTRILLLVDGHRINDNVYDQAQIEEDFQVDLRDVEQIEVIRGPSSSLYGSSAFFGVINVVTKSAPAGGHEREASLDGGSLGRRLGRIRLGHAFANGMSASLSASAQRTDGNHSLYFPEYDAADTNFGRAIGLDGMTRTNLFGRLAAGHLVVKAGFNSRDRAFPTGAYETAFNDGRPAVIDRHFISDAIWDHAFGAWKTRVRGAYDHYTFEGRYPYAENGAVRQYIDAGTGDWFTGELQLSRSLGAHNVTGGTEYRDNIRQDQFSYYSAPREEVWTDRQDSDTLALFVQDEWRVHPKLLLNAGLRYDRYIQFNDPIKPRFAAIFHPHEETAIKFVYGEAFRAPNVFESFYIIPGQWKMRPDLRAENIRTTEAIVEHYAGRRLRLAGSAFLYHVDDLVNFTSDDADGMFLFANMDSAKATGLEGEVEAKWPDGSQLRVSYTYSRARGADGSTLSNSPAHLAQAAGSLHLFGQTFVSLDAQFMGDRLSRSGERVARYVQPNLTLSSRVASRLHAALTIANMTGTRYADPVSDDYRQQTVPQDGRTVRAQLSWTF